MVFDSIIQKIIDDTGEKFSLDDILDRHYKINNKYNRSEFESEIKTLLLKESKKQDGLVIQLTENDYMSRKKMELELKQKILKQIKEQGFKIDKNNLIHKPPMNCKNTLRDFHYSACFDKYKSCLKFILKKEKKLINYFAEGNEIDIESIEPKLEVVPPESIKNDLFRYASFLWSVPVSNGFGRRTRFLVWDNSNKKLIGIFALGDPVFNLTCRDNWIGWDHNARTEKLYNVMDIFILGSVPPYNILLGGKLIAMIAASNEVRKIIYRKYSKKKTIITNKSKNPKLVLLTTGSALGKSSIYARIKFRDRILYNRIGTTVGWGHFHLNHGLFDNMRKYLELTDSKVASANRFGQGPNWKIRVARTCLKKLGLPEQLLRHGIQREIYGIPLAENFAEFLRGETKQIIPFDIPFNEVSNYWKDRWLINRIKRKPEYKNYKRMDTIKMIHRFGKINEFQKQLQVCQK